MKSELAHNRSVNCLRNGNYRSVLFVAAIISAVACAPGASEADQSTNSDLLDEIPQRTAPISPTDQSARQHKLQVSLSFTAAFNLEDPFLNIAKSTFGSWRYILRDNENLPAEDALELGFTDPQTGLPKSMPKDGVAAVGGQVFSQISHYPDHYSGKYVFEWDGDAYGIVHGQPRDLQYKDGQNRIRFSIRPDNVKARALRFSQVKGNGVQGIRLFRAEHEDLLKAGKIWNPTFLDFAKKYDIIRTMDMQGTNNWPVRAFDEIATMDSPSWGAGHSRRWPAPPYYSIPYEALFNLGVETGRELWLHIPPQIGSPKHQNHPSLAYDDRPNIADPEKLRAHAKENVSEILDSSEWDIFAEQFVDRLISSGYPKNRPLYIELGNEIWNFSGGFVYSTYYAWGVGEGIYGKAGMRHGYGILTARWMIALEKALQARNANYNITYIVASHTAWADRTRIALNAMKDYFQKSGVDADAMLKKSGVTLTTYFGSRKAFEETILGKLSAAELVRVWEKEISENPRALADKVTQHFASGPASSIGTVPWVMANWRAHQKIANQFGINVIGAYEGGSHIEPPAALMKSEKFEKWWTAYHWGADGAKLLKISNDAILAEFPDAILSNYASMGPIGEQPWYDGHYADETPMMKMWDEYAIPASQR